MYIYVCLHVYVYIYTYTCIYIYIEREREREDTRCKESGGDTGATGMAAMEVNCLSILDPPISFC